MSYGRIKSRIQRKLTGEKQMPYNADALLSCALAITSVPTITNLPM
jgi:hypothetical protein